MSKYDPDDLVKLIEFVKLMKKKNKKPSPNHSKKTVRPIKLKRPKPIPRLKKRIKKHRRTISYDKGIGTDIMEYDPYRTMG